MSDQKTYSTWELLQEFGFEPDVAVFSDVSPGLSFEFGNFKLSASCVLNEKLIEVVLFTGVIATSRTVAEVSFQLPRQVTSPEICAAWVVWNLNRYVKDGHFAPERQTPWVQQGHDNQGLLPWVTAKRPPSK